MIKLSSIIALKLNYVTTLHVNTQRYLFLQSCAQLELEGLFLAVQPSQKDEQKNQCKHLKVMSAHNYQENIRNL